MGKEFLKKLYKTLFGSSMKKGVRQLVSRQLSFILFVPMSSAAFILIESLFDHSQYLLASSIAEGGMKMAFIMDQFPVKKPKGLFLF